LDSGLKIVVLYDYNFNRYWDARLYFMDAGAWAKKYCPSFQVYEIKDLSQTASTIGYQIAEYTFTDDKDVIWFTLKWV
jgi:hypothetical protein